MPVYRDESKKKNQFWYEFETGKDPLTGKRTKIRKKGFASEKEAKAALAKAETEFNEGNYIDPSRMKLSDYMLNNWLAIKSNLVPATRDLYEDHIKNHIVPSFLGNEQLSKLSATGIQNFIIHLTEKEIQKNKKLSPNTIQKIYSVLNTSLNDAVTMKLIRENPATLILNKPRVKKSNTTVWNENEIRKFVQESEGKSRYSLVFRFTLMTGLRQGEVLGMRWSDVDFNANLVRITHTLTHDGKTLKKGAKTKSSVRVVRLDEKTKIELLKHYNLQQMEKKEFENARLRKAAKGKEHFQGRSYKNNDLVFCTNLGTPCSPRNLMRAFYDLLEVINVPRITFHEIRHTQATLLLKKNVHPKIVSERLGHSSIKITLDTYSHMLPEMQESAVQSLANVL